MASSTPTRSTLSSMLMILAAACLWGTTGTAQALTPESSSPLVIGTMRLVIGGGTLLLISALKQGFRQWDFCYPLIVLTGCFVALFQVSFFSGVRLTGVTVGTIVGLGSSPIFAGAFDALILKKFPGWRWVASTVLALLGCIILTLSSGEIQINIWGILLAITAGFAYASYALTIKKLIQEQQAEEVTALVFCTGAILLSPILFTHDLSWIKQVNGWLPLVHLGIFATALPYYLFARGIQHIPAPFAVTLSLAEPMTATILGVLIVGEKLAPVSWVGLSLILSGVIVLVLPSHLFKRTG